MSKSKVKIEGTIENKTWTQYGCDKKVTQSCWNTYFLILTFYSGWACYGNRNCWKMIVFQQNKNKHSLTTSIHQNNLWFQTWIMNTKCNWQHLKVNDFISLTVRTNLLMPPMLVIRAASSGGLDMLCRDCTYQI